MSEKVVLIADPGIDGAFAIALALRDSRIEVQALLATPGNVSAEQATANIHILIEQFDPPRWPRVGAAPAIEYEMDGHNLHGFNGLGGVTFPCSTLHHLLPGEKVLVETVKQHPRQVTVVCLGPCTVLARAMDLFPELPAAVKRIVLLGGTLKEPGNAGPVSEFHFACDPLSARQVLRSGAPIVLIPLDVMRQVLFSPTDLLGLPMDGSKACSFLRQIVPFGIAATSSLYGIEGFHLKDVLGVVAVALPKAIETHPMSVDIELRGELTRGMTVFDRRPWERKTPNVELAMHIDSQGVRDYMKEMLLEGKGM